MASAKKVVKDEEVVSIKPIRMKTVKVRVVGDTPLIIHAFSAKSKREILEKEIGAAKIKAREEKNPIADFCSSLYWLTPMPEEFTEEAVAEAIKTARFGFPVAGFKKAAISAAYRMGWSKDKASLRGAFFIEPDSTFYYGGDLRVDYEKKIVDIIPNLVLWDMMIEIKGDAPVMREDVVKIGPSKVADLRYRGEFENWSADLVIKYNENGKYSLDDIINILNAGGIINGIGEYRSERDGQAGAYHIEAA